MEVEEENVHIDIGICIISIINSSGNGCPVQVLSISAPI